VTRTIESITASSDTDEEREEAMSSYQLADVIRRLEQIEKRLGVLENERSPYRGSEIGVPNRSGGPHEQGPVERAVPPGGSKPLPHNEPPPLLEPLLEQGGASEGGT
jgi:hypothetical protein